MGVSASHAFLAPMPARGPLSVRPSTILSPQPAVAAIAAQARGASTRLVGISRAEDFQALIVHRSTGLRRGRDLRDRRIGLPAADLQSGSPRAHAMRGAIAVLESEALFFRHVQWVDLPPAESVMLTLPTAYAAEFAALHNGLVDAIYVRGPAGLEAARAAGARVLCDIGAHPDPWLRLNTALLRAITVSETLLIDHPDVIAHALLERWPLLPADTTLDEGLVGALSTLKSFLLRWAFIHTDFTMDSWIDCQPAQPGTWHLRQSLHYRA